MIQFAEKGGGSLVSFDDFIMEPGVPIYAQIIRYVKGAVAAGAVADGEELPSRRVLSALLGVNPNTIQKAYRLLEEEGLIRSHPGAKSYVSAPPERAAAIRGELLAAEARRAAEALRRMGLDRGAALELIGRLWDEGEEET